MMKPTTFSHLLYAILAVLSTYLKSSSAKSDSLVYLHVLFRHGNRTPEKTSQFPTDPNLNETFDPFGYGQLTTKGKETEYQIGQYLRQTYNDFIPAQYTPNMVYALSTDFKRTKMSLELVLAGLFPPLESDVFHNGLNWQPIPFNIDENGLISMPIINCPSFIRQYFKYILSSEGRTIMNSYRHLYNFISNSSGYEVASPDDVLEIYETLESEKDYGLELPEWTSDIFPEVMGEAASVYFKFSTTTSGLRRVTNGYFLKKMLDDSLAKTEGTLPKERKIALYSAHDVQIGTLLYTLGFDYQHVPPYGATIIFEIHNKDGVDGLKLYYQNYTQKEPKLLTIPGCSSFCGLVKFAELMSDNLPGKADTCMSSGE